MEHGTWIALDIWERSIPGDVSWNCRCRVCGFEGPIGDEDLCKQRAECPVCKFDGRVESKCAERRRKWGTKDAIRRRLRRGLGAHNKDSKIGTGGYVLVRMPDHPNAGVSGYVLEHRLVVEAKIGRLLTRKETVHHRNGVRDQNDIDNLELWASNHPPGQRVSDLVSWAQELLSMYALEELRGGCNI